MEQKSGTSVAWTTADEIKFIDSLGYHTQNQFGRAALLKSYGDAIAKRADWDHMRPEKVRRHLAVAQTSSLSAKGVTR